MKVWAVTEEIFSHEGLEGAFDVFVGVAATALDALGIIELEAGVHPGGRHPSRILIGKGYEGSSFEYSERNNPLTEENAVTLETWSPRFDWINGKQVERPEGHWSHHTTWHVREVDVAGSENLHRAPTRPAARAVGVRRFGSSAEPADAEVDTPEWRYHNDVAYYFHVNYVGNICEWVGRFFARWAP